MQYGPDGVPVSTKSIIIGPPTKTPAPVPVTTTKTVIGPIQYDTGPTLIDEDTNVPIEEPYAVVVAEDGSILTNKVTVLNFTGNGVALTNLAGEVTITITDTIGLASVSAGTGISVSTSNNVATVTNTFTEIVYAAGNVTGNVTPNRSNGTIQKYTLIGNITLNVPTNMAAGQSLTLILTQDSVGNRLLDANVAYLFASGYQTLTTDSNGIDMINIFSDGTKYYATLTTDYS